MTESTKPKDPSGDPIKNSPYARIIRAADKGRGVRLTASEVYNMANFDTAINTRGRKDNEGIHDDDW